MTSRLGGIAALALLLSLFGCARDSRTPVEHMDAQLASDINSIKAIDNHAHPTRVVYEGEKDSEFDALPVELMETYDSMPLRLRPDNVEYSAAWRKLYGPANDDMRDDHVKQAMEAKRRVIKEKGDQYDTWVLDQLGIDIMFANRVAMGRGLPP